jgi:hypothetical protein
MRWKKKKAPDYGDRRIISEFLFFPKTLDGETRWLEFAEIIQSYLGAWCRWVDSSWHNGEGNPR